MLIDTRTLPKDEQTYLELRGLYEAAGYSPYKMRRFEEYSLYAYADEPTLKKKKPNVVADAFRFLGSLFTKRGWRAVERELIITCDIPYVGKTQPMLGVWLAIGFSAVYWVLALLQGLL